MGIFTINRVFAVALIAALARPIYHNLIVIGVFRAKESASAVFTAENQENYHIIADTVQCEDLHYWPTTNQIFTACEDEPLPRFKWFPALSHLDGPPTTTASIHVIDPQTMKSTRLAFENFSGPFVTHGLDVLEDPEKPNAVYIFAVNHLGNPDWTPGSKDVPAARSQVEIFHHVLNSKTIRYVRSARHPLITTPNDIYAQSPTSFWVSNDHAYRDGLMRHVEDIVPFLVRTSVIHVQVDNLQAGDAADGVDAVVAIGNLYNNNGLGHGSSKDEILIASAMGGVMYRARVGEDGRTLTVVDEISINTAIDNPSYYTDPYASPSSGNASGYLQAGLRRPVDFVKTHDDPNGRDGAIVVYMRPDADGGWERRVLFEDDGTNIRSSSAAVMVPIKPKKGDDRKEAWLFVSGFIANSAVAVKVQL